MPLHDDRHQLAPQLGHRLRDPLHGESQPRNRESRYQSRRQGLLPLGKLLSHLCVFCLGLDLRE